MGFTRRSLTCLFSSCCSQWSEGLHCIIAAHQQHLCQEKRYCQEDHPDHSCFLISQDIDLVAGDFNGTAWLCRSRDSLSTIDEVFTDCALPTPPGSTPLW